MRYRMYVKYMLDPKLLNMFFYIIITFSLTSDVIKIKRQKEAIQTHLLTTFTNIKAVN